MPSDDDQAAPQQSIQERLSAVVMQNTTTDDADAGPSTDQDTTDQVDDSDDDEPSEPQVETVDEVEVEFDNWKGKIPAKLKAEIDKGADYTKKTQTLSEDRKIFDTERRIQHEYQMFTQSAQKEVNQLTQIDAQLEQYRTVDLSQIDGETLARMSMAAANLREEKARLKETLESKRSEFKGNMIQQWDQMATQARDVIVKSVPNWDGVASEVAQYALNVGFPFEHITGYDRKTKERVGPGVVSPEFATTVYKAMQWDKLQSSKVTATAKVAKAAPVFKQGAPSNVQATTAQKALRQQHKQKGSVESAAALLRKFF